MICSGSTYLTVCKLVVFIIWSLGNLARVVKAIAFRTHSHVYIGNGFI